MLIGTCGFGSTGSSAVSDYLTEFDTFQVLDTIEFNWVYDVDGLIDLTYHILNPHNRHKDAAVAIERYISRLRVVREYYSRSTEDFALFEEEVRRFVDRIAPVSWYSRDLTYIPRSNIEHRIRRRVMAHVRKAEQKQGRQLNKWPLKQIYMPYITPEAYYAAAKEHTETLLRLIGAKDGRPIVTDQPFAGSNPQAAFPFFEDPYAVVVDRDPRDNYVFLRTKLAGKNHFAPVNDVRDYVLYFRSLRDNRPYKEQNDRILRLQFEELVYDYDNAAAKLRQFLNTGENPHPKSIFDPAVSIANTQVFKRFKQYEDEVKYIEDNLTEYLFDFGRYPEPDLSGKMFYGRAPRKTGK